MTTRRWWISLLLVLVSVAAVQAREFRGAWIASVHNLNWPSRAGDSPAAQKAELIALLDAAKRAGLNAVLLQVRPESDALYRSGLDPWSRFLTGTQGADPGWDPLAFALEEGHRRGLEVHAWLNPYRALVNVSKPMAAGHIAKRYPQYAHRVGNLLVMDPGAPEVQDHVVRVAADIARRYPVDGIHYDDYFYPYPPAGERINFPDGATYRRYQAGGGKLPLADWRRENVNRLIQRTAAAVKAARPGVVFGVSPFGIYTKGQPATVQAGLDMLNQLHADPVHWMKAGWVDYLAPQLYWRDGSKQSFSELLRWWRSPAVNPRQVAIYPGIAVDRLTEQGWPAAEIVRQVGLSRSLGPGPRGHIFWSIKPLARDTKGVTTALRRAGY